ncbi:MAG: monothiol glutaredoxin [Gammaproteobacteria bacterium]|jgi:monothiol glutaredoxin
MPLTEETRSRIDDLLATNEVVLFMKGTPQQPQCGFSATVTGLLGGIVPDYTTVNVLEDQEIREGIKEYSQWPTIPQLYIRNEFVGGCDVIQQMHATGDLHSSLGVEVGEDVTPTISISESASKAIGDVAQQNPGSAVHLKITANWNHEFSMSPPRGHEVVASSNGIEVLLDRDSARRADGLEIDMVEGPQGGGFSISNPNAPAPVKQMEVEDLKAKLDAGDSFQLLDVRDMDERERAVIEGSKMLDSATVAEIEKLPKETELVFHCHSGVRSQSAAEHFRGLGFVNVSNVAGGIDAWSQRIDSSVARY